ncbi:MAG: tetratricopeptide repeat protein [Candidatus Eisenbacteria bacterium]|nr:tetratricopeptide repeat protein [Candidatus Eisenbacteria bacterium]
MPGRRITRREMKEDRLVTFALRAFDYVRENAGKMAVAAVVAAFVVVGAVYVSHVRRDSEDKASFLLAQGNSEYWAGRMASAQSFFSEGSSRYPGATDGKIARLRLGDTQLFLGKYSDAIESYREFLKREKKNQVLILSAKRGLAIALEDQKSYVEAAREYEGIANSFPKGDPQVSALLDAVRSLRSGGRTDDAVKILKRIVSEYPNVRNIRQIKSLLFELEARIKGKSGLAS